MQKISQPEANTGRRITWNWIFPCKYSPQSRVKVRYEWR